MDKIERKWIAVAAVLIALNASIFWLASLPGFEIGILGDHSVAGARLFVDGREDGSMPSAVPAPSPSATDLQLAWPIQRSLWLKEPEHEFVLVSTGGDTLRGRVSLEIYSLVYVSFRHREMEFATSRDRSGASVGPSSVDRHPGHGRANDGLSPGYRPAQRPSTNAPGSVVRS